MLWSFNTVPVESGSVSVRSVDVPLGVVMLNVAVPLAGLTKAILLMLVLLPELQPVRSKL